MNETPTIDDLRGAFRSGEQTFTCPICEKTISLPHKCGRRRKYCPDCSAVVNRQKEHERHHKHWLEVKAKRAVEREKKKHKRESQIDNLAAAAKAAGMSYGRYVALREAGRI